MDKPESDTGLPRLKGRVGDLFRRDRQVRVHPGDVGGAYDGAGGDDVIIHDCAFLFASIFLRHPGTIRP